MFYTWLEVGKERGLLQNFNTSLNDLRLELSETVKTPYILCALNFSKFRVCLVNLRANNFYIIT